MHRRDRKNWTRDEVLIAFNLYCRTPFGKIDEENDDIMRIAPLLGRSTGALVFKMFNLAHHDPEQQARGVEGFRHGSKLDGQIWDEFRASPNKVLAESKVCMDSLGKITEPGIIPREGKEVGRIIHARVNQQFFREVVLASYNNKCCITGIPVPELLNASHIKPWSDYPDQRLDPQNGLALNALHDRAFDRGLITVTPDYRVKVSEHLRVHVKEPEKLDFINKYDGQFITNPERFPPSKEFLEYHSSHVFKEP